MILSELFAKYKTGILSSKPGTLPLRHMFLQIAKYGISGITGGLLQITILYILVDRFGVWYLHGVVSAFTVSLIFTFLLQKFWTFKDYSTDKLHTQSFTYIMIAMFALALNVVLMYTLVDIFHLWHITAQTVVVFSVGVLTFLMNRLITFRT